MLKDLVKKSRTYRRFHEDQPIDTETLKSLVDLARFCPSAGNLQPLKYFISNNKGKNDLIFSCLSWAGHIKDWKGPTEGEKPTAYIVMLGDNNIKTQIVCDEGIAAQTIMLGATEKGLGACILHAVNRTKLRNFLNIPETLEIVLVIALGKPKEQVVLDEGKNGNDTRYWRDSNQIHHVPKRSLESIILDNFPEAGEK